MNESKEYEKDDEEDGITALPISDPLRTSPHLRPATRAPADIPYNFLPHSLSLTSLQSLDKSASYQRGQQRFSQVPSQNIMLSKNKRGAGELGLSRRRSSKKQKDDHLREEEIRAMSAPIVNVNLKRPAAQNAGLLRQDSKKMRSALNRYLSQRPDSSTSLRPEASPDSTMSGSEPRAVIVGGLGLLTPRPTIRLSTVPHSSSFDRSVPRRASPQDAHLELIRETQNEVASDPLREHRRIDDLADVLDSGALRELMERDQRRRDKKRKLELERAQRKLQRRAEKQKAEELGLMENMLMTIRIPDLKA